MSLNPPHPVTVFLSLLPLFALMLAIEWWGLNHFGVTLGDFGRVRIPEERTLKYVIFYGVAAISGLLLGSMLLRNLTPGFNLQSTFGSCFILLAYAYSPLFLTRALDAFPRINTWICWGIGALLAMRLLYHGVAYWLKPEQTKGLGVFMLSVICTVVLSALVHFASVQVLHGRFLHHRVLNPGAPEAVTNAAPVSTNISP